MQNRALTAASARASPTQIARFGLGTDDCSSDQAHLQIGGYVRARRRPVPVTMRDLISGAA